MSWSRATKFLFTFLILYTGSNLPSNEL
ncbi:unnamed protein product [Chondrus crispus]|uniref:Uncharacterized protein n=1 Tax=Chondrus crispus TaxID=2769 RepID=R7Q9I7_CHOCR|nr:unnamed protein product [Chondrus crispus]CDF34140.1 unnamed protein product [Chondrus crispus]|eukprot:XP_005713959.1 unnamed protein product [Chondrus crispus]